MPGFWSRDLDQLVFDLVVFDNGLGPALYAVGGFQRANGRLVDGFARWDGYHWTGLGDPFGTWGSGGATALAVFDDGTGAAIYAGGISSDPQGGGRPIVAKWSGGAWTVIGLLSNPTPNSPVTALAVFDDGSGAALYASGGFDTAYGLRVNSIARWDGTSWQPLAGPHGVGLDEPAFALEVWDDGGGEALFVGGWFAVAGGVEVNGVAKWDGTEWEALSGPAGVGTDGVVRAFEVWDDGTGPALFAGGTFNDAGGIFTNHIAKWDGSAWSPLTGSSGTGIAGGSFDVESLAVHDDGSGPQLVVGGDFTLAGGIDARNIARWSGSEWSALEGPFANGTAAIVRTLATFDDGGWPMLFAGGDFDLAGGRTVGKIARWDGAAWSPLSSPTGHGLGSAATALAVYDGGGGPEVIAGGTFAGVGEIPASAVAAWNGSSWSAL